jgi:hypothetical protein
MNNGGKYGNSIRDGRPFAALDPITVKRNIITSTKLEKRRITFFTYRDENQEVERRFAPHRIGANKSCRVGLVLVYCREVQQNLAAVPK